MLHRERAETVREMFRSYLAGASIWGIKKELERKHISSPTGKETWPSRTIDLMLSNEKYTGNIILFKTVMANYPYSVRRINDSFRVSDLSDGSGNDHNLILPVCQSGFCQTLLNL